MLSGSCHKKEFCSVGTLDCTEKWVWLTSEFTGINEQDGNLVWILLIELLIKCDINENLL